MSGENIIRFLLKEVIGEDLTREGLRETPLRVVDAWREWTEGYRQHPHDVFKVFEDGAEHYDEIVLVRDIPVYSHCEHHLAPFFGIAHVGYIPNKRIVGLSKIPRLIDVFAKRLQVQERLTTQIAETMHAELDSKGVAVVLECRHMCMESRGIMKQGSTTITSSMLGCFRDEADTRAEFLSLIRR